MILKNDSALYQKVTKNDLLTWVVRFSISLMTVFDKPSVFATSSILRCTPCVHNKKNEHLHHDIYIADMYMAIICKYYTYSQSLFVASPPRLPQHPHTQSGHQSLVKQTGRECMQALQDHTRAC